jgi:hypothetical protein
MFRPGRAGRNFERVSVVRLIAVAIQPPQTKL